MDSNNNRRSSSRRSSSSSNTPSRGGENRRRRRREPDNSTTIGKARIIWNNLLDMISKRGPKFVILIIVFGAASFFFELLAKATATTGGFQHGLWVVLAVVTKYLGFICVALGAFVLVRNVVRSFDSDGIETPDKQYFKKFHQLKYELFDGVNDEPTTRTRRSQRRPATTTATTEAPETASALDVDEDDD